MKNISLSINPDNTKDQDDPINSDIAYGRLVGSVCGALLALAIITIFSAALSSATIIFSVLTFIGRSVGGLLATNKLRKTPIVEVDHVASLQRILKTFVPEEHIFEATKTILMKDPHPVLLRDPVWISHHIPNRLLNSSKNSKAKSESLIIKTQTPNIDSGN